MANEFARNIQDASINPATFTLPSTASASTTSAVIDLGSDTFKPERIELELSVPALTSVMAPSSSTVGADYIIESSTTSTFSATARQISRKTIVPTATSGIAATKLRTRLPSDCERYVRAKITYGATMADSSTLAGTFTARF